jgi:hypothetical protein
VIEGCDYSYDPPSPSGLAAAGKKFVVRYGALGNAGKFLTAAEVRALTAAGLDIVANVEETAQAFRGTVAGVRQAAAGNTFFQALGMPAHRPLYFSADWDAQPADWPDIDAALKGAASVIGPGRVGVYGGYDTIAHCASAGTAAWFWQTYAWSTWTNPATGQREVRWHPRCHLQQYRNNVALAGGTVDLDRATASDYGQWGQEDDMPTKTEFFDWMNEWAATVTGKARLGAAAWDYLLEDPLSTTVPKGKKAAGTYQRWIDPNINRVIAATKTAAGDVTGMMAATFTPITTGISELRALLSAAGGHPDLAPVVARLDELEAAVSAAAGQAADVLAERIAEAMRRSADTVEDGTP